jgi:hypothetical protein
MAKKLSQLLPEEIEILDGSGLLHHKPIILPKPEYVVSGNDYFDWPIATKVDDTIVPDYPKATNNVLSVVAWVRADSRSRWASIAKNWAPDKEGQFHFGLLHDQGGLEIQISDALGGQVQVVDPDLLPLGEWQHVAFVADGAFLRLYRNGSEVGRKPYSGLAKPTIKALGIGAKRAGTTGEKARGPSGFWDGRIDELAIFNHALDGESIRRLSETENEHGMVAAKRR